MPLARSTTGNSGPELDVALRECPPLWPVPTILRRRYTVWCEPFDASSGQLPRYARAHYPPGSAPSSGVVVGYRIGDARTNRVAVFLPSVAALDQRLLQYLRRAQLILVDGTFWTTTSCIAASAAVQPRALDFKTDVLWSMLDAIEHFRSVLR